jgi:hypothetical protein
MTVEWKTVDGKLSCYNLDGEIHWDACSKNLFDELKRTGTHYTEKVGNETRHGYRSEKFGKKAYSCEGTHTKGKGYKPVEHEPTCNAAPWEDCTCQTNLCKTNA